MEKSIYNMVEFGCSLYFVQMATFTKSVVVLSRVNIWNY